MNLALTDEELAFRDEMRTFFRTQIPADIREAYAHGEELGRDRMVEAQQILNAHGLAVPHWPVEWGGRDWTPVQHNIWLDELQLASVPEPLAFNATWSVRSSRPSARRSRRRSSFRRLRTSTSGGARDSPNPRPVPISLRSRPVRSATATTGSSMVRRPGRRWDSTPTGSSASCAPIPMRPSVRPASRSSLSI